MKEFEFRLLAHVEKFAQFLQRTFGITPLQAALLGCGVAGVCFLGVGMIMPGYPPFAKVVSTFAGISVVLFSFWLYPKLERRIANDAAKGFENTLKQSFAFIRAISSLFLFVDVVILLSPLPLTIGILYDTILSCAMWVAVYFASCNPLPPGESKVKKFIASLVGKQRRLA